MNLIPLDLLNRLIFSSLIGVLSGAGYIAMHATLASRDVVSIFVVLPICVGCSFVYHHRLKDFIKDILYAMSRLI